MNRRRALLTWYRRRARDLPWRRTRDPYAIWVAEVMLQQTQVATVIPYYERFLDRFPDVGTLACAPDDEVLSLWSGLGYYRRARDLRDGARVVAERHGGRLPTEVEVLMAIPGIGRYTAGAISSIAYRREAPVVDGNVRRVLSRWFAGEAGEASGSGADRRLWQRAAELVRGEAPGDWNQALMELGATVCTPRAPDCRRCPVAEPCQARLAGDPERFPPPRPRRRQERIRAAVAIVRRGDRVLLERPAAGNPLRGSWDLPSREEDGLDASARLVREFRDGHEVDLVLGQRLGHADHGILHRTIRLEIYEGRLRRGRVAACEGLRWAALSRIGELPVSGATRKVLARIATPLASTEAKAPRSRPAQ